MRKGIILLPLLDKYIVALALAGFDKYEGNAVFHSALPYFKHAPLLGYEINRQIKANIYDPCQFFLRQQ